MSANYRAALQEILTDRPISYHRVYAILLGGDVEAGVWLAQMIFWSGRGHDADGWITKTAAEMRDEIGISERGHERAWRTAYAKGVIETDRSTRGGVRRFRVAWECLFECIGQCSGKDETAIPERTERPFQKGQNAGSRKDAQGDSRKDKSDTSIYIDDNIDDNIDDAGKRRPKLDAPPALKSQPPAPRKAPVKKHPVQITEHADKRIADYIDVSGKPITPSSIDTIFERVSLERASVWRETLEAFAGNGWRLDILGNVLDAYDKRVNALRFQKAGPKPAATEHAFAAYARKLRGETTDAPVATGEVIDGNWK